MPDITIKEDDLYKIIKESLPVVLKEKLTSSYGNPISKMIEEEIIANDGAIRVFVRETLSSILSDEKFKDLITKELLGAILAKGLGKN